MSINIAKLLGSSRRLYSADKIKSLIIDNTTKEMVNLKNICKELKITIQPKPELSKNWAKIYFNKNNDVIFEIDMKLDYATKKILLALACAEYILTPDRLHYGGIIYDMFSLNDLHSQQRTYRLLLATRLVMPENIIRLIQEQTFQLHDYCKSICILPDFARASLNENSALFCLTTGT